MLGSVDVIVGTIKISILDLTLGNLDQSTCYSLLIIVDPDALLKTQ